MQQDGGSQASLREMANWCRDLAAGISDERASASLRRLAEQYDGAADAARMRQLYDAESCPPPALDT